MEKGKYPKIIEKLPKHSIGYLSMFLQNLPQQKYQFVVSFSFLKNISRHQFIVICELS